VRHRWPAFEDRPFDHRPPAGAAGFRLRDLVSYGRAAGRSGPGFASRVRGRWYAGQLRQASRTAIAGGVNGTPTVKVNGRTLATNETLTAEGSRAAVTAAG
jgi:hypothetical protein